MIANEPTPPAEYRGARSSFSFGNRAARQLWNIVWLLLFRPTPRSFHAWIAARAIVQMGVTIGDGCVVGAGSVVTRDLPAWTICAGVPCRPIRSYERR